MAVLLAGAMLVAGVACDGGRGRPASPTPGDGATSATAALATRTAAATPPAPTTEPEPSATGATPPASPTPAPGPARLVYRGDASRRVVALTFDAGSDAGFTAQILDTLAAQGIRASFGVTGKWGEQNPELLLAIAAQGHEFINHSYDHASFTGRSTGAPALTAEERALELSRTETTVFRITGRTTHPLFRPPYGDIDASVQADAGADGYPWIIMWTIDTLGWNGATADEIVARVAQLAEPGAIIVMHVGADSQDGVALPRVIDGLRAAGYGFAPVSEILPR
jgi:peptidoglycan/xylan/chitin deacetylase (PgdA/CDA1 family)